MISSEEVSVLQETCRNTRMAIDSIETVMNKVYDEELAYELYRQADRYRQFQQRAEGVMREEGLEPGGGSRLEKAMLWSSIQANTLLNTSTGHMADMMIEGNTRGITGLMKTVHNNKLKGSYANEIANELMDFEEKNIEKLKSYL